MSNTNIKHSQKKKHHHDMQPASSTIRRSAVDVESPSPYRNKQKRQQVHQTEEERQKQRNQENHNSDIINEDVLHQSESFVMSSRRPPSQSLLSSLRNLDGAGSPYPEEQQSIHRGQLHSKVEQIYSDRATKPERTTPLPGTYTNIDESASCRTLERKKVGTYAIGRDVQGVANSIEDVGRLSHHPVTHLNYPTSPTTSSSVSIANDDLVDERKIAAKEKTSRVQEPQSQSSFGRPPTTFSLKPRPHNPGQKLSFVVTPDNRRHSHPSNHHQDRRQPRRPGTSSEGSTRSQQPKSPKRSAGAVRVVPGGVSNQSVAALSNADQSDGSLSNSANDDQAFVIGQALDPLPAYTVPEDDEGEVEDVDKSQGRGQLNDDIEVLRNELQQIGNAVDNFYEALDNVASAEIAATETTLQSQQRDREDDDDKRQTMKHRRTILALILVVVILVCAGLPVVLLVVRTDPGPTAPRENDMCFHTREELLEAVDTFLVGDDVGENSTLAKRYSWPMNEWCVGKVQDFSSLFAVERNSLAVNFNEDISSWDMSSATNIESLFDRAEAFNADDLTSWNVSKVINMRYVFNGAISFNGNVSTWDVSNVMTLRSMFRNSLFTGDISAWNVSKVQIFESMFDGSPFNGNISSWDVCHATNMISMFQHTSNFNQDLSSWDVSDVVDMSYMFNDATLFDEVISTWDVSNVTIMRGLFRDSVFTGNISTWNVSRVSIFEAMFSGTEFNGDISRWDVSGATNMKSMFQQAKSFNQDISGWDVSGVIDTSWMFLEATSFNQDLSSWDVSSVVSFFQQFSWASSFRQDLCPWADHIRDDANVKEMFMNTACESNDDPGMLGPFCFVCDAT